MKKLFLTLTVIGLSSAALLAQGISGGVKLGANFANQKWSASGISISPDSRTSFHGGVYLNVAFSDKLSLQPELLFNSVGAKINFDGSNSKLVANYISIPVMIKYNIVPVFNIQVGPQLGFLMSAKSGSDDVKSSFKSTDLGLGFGAGVDLPMGLNFTARYVLGLSNVGNKDDFGDTTIKNNVIQLSVGYRLFGAGK